MDNGWIKLHRKIVNWRFFKNSEIYHLFTTLILLANHKDGFTKDGTLIKKGQLMASRRTLSLETGLEESKVNRILKKLKSEQEIELLPSSKNTIITIVNYDEYQSGEQESEQQVNSERTASEQQVNTNKNANNNKKKKNNIFISPLAFLFSPDDEIQTWLLTGTEAAQKELLEKHSHHVLAEQVKNAYLWQLENKSRNAGSFLIMWMNRNTQGFGLNPAQKSFKTKTNGVTATPQNPTGNPYIQEALEKGLL